MTLAIDSPAPPVTPVTSTTANGAYGVGSAIPITVGWSEAVTVTGTPNLALNSGGTASYSSGSGSSTLTFTYTTAAGENSADLDYNSTSALTLNGGTIKDAAGNAATLTLASPGASGSLGANKNIVINTGSNHAPTTNAISSPQTVVHGTTTTNFSLGIQDLDNDSITVTVTLQDP